MAVLYITEYADMARDAGGHLAPVGQEPARANQAVTFTTSTQSAAFGATTRMVRLVADADCHLLFGIDPTATTAHQLLPANTETWRGVRPGDKVAAVTAG